MKQRKTLDNSISKTEWVNHFKELYRLTVQDSGVEQQLNDSPLYIDDLDHEVSPDEVRFAIRKLQRLAKLRDMTVFWQRLLTTLFNHVFSSGIFPYIWANSVTVPIHKKSDIHCVDNNRSVPLLSIVSQSYTSILNNRSYNLAEDCGKITESQAGFRKGYSTTDHIFALYAMTQKY